MMTLVDMTLIAEHAAAVARLDADLVIASNGSTGQELQVLRRRALSAYRTALSSAAGAPFDPCWNVLALCVDTFVAHAEAGTQSRDARAALERLDALRIELLPDALDRRSSIAG